jgi:diguanylate cyclase (GGDEF)-like protein
MSFAILRIHPAQVAVLAGSTLVLALLVHETRDVLETDYRAQVESIQASVDKTAERLAALTSETFDQVSRSTLVVNFVQGRRPAPTLTELELAGVIDKGVADPMFIADVTGHVLDATTSSGTSYVADEPFFQQHRVSTDRGLRVGRVWVDRVAGAARIPVTRRLEVGGRFQGVVCAMVDPARITAAHGRHEAPGTLVGVLGDDGYYRSRLSAGRMTFDEHLDPRVVAAQIAESRATRRPGRSRVDGSERFAAMVQVAGYPLHALVAVSADEALAPYRHGRRQTLRWAFGMAAGILFGAAVLLRLARSLDESRARTRRAEATFRAALEGSLDAVFILEAVRRPSDGRLVDLRVRDCNERAAQGLGTDRTGLLGASFSERLPVSAREYLRAFQHVMSTGRPAQGEIECSDPGLEGVWLHHQIVPLEDGAALISRDVTGKKAIEAELSALGRIDSLTSLANRRGFEERLREAMLRCRRAPMNGCLALLYIDLDGFKRINDTLGHEAGDAVLVEVARRLRSATRETDVVARLGGDEFAVVAENAGAVPDVEALATRVLEQLSAPHVFGEVRVTATPSIGIAFHHSEESPEVLRKRADVAMYAAKAAGKGRFAWDDAAAARILAV